MTTRDGSAASRSGARLASPAFIDVIAAARYASGVLQRRDQGQCRLRALVAVDPVGVQAVESATGLGVPHELAGVVVAGEPGRGSPDSVGPSSGGVDGGGARARVGKTRHLDRLLIERRADGRPGPRPATGVGDRWPSSVSMSSSQASRSRPALPEMSAPPARHPPRSSPRRARRWRRSVAARATASQDHRSAGYARPRSR